MTNASAPAKPTAPKRRRWLRITAIVLTVLVVLLVIAYFVGTSSAFLKAVILPRAGAALNSDISVSSASIHPFHSITLRDLKVQPHGVEPLVTAPEVRLRYSLFDIIGGKLNIAEVAMVSPTVSVIQHPDGTSNLDPLLKALNSEPKKPETQKEPSKPPQVNLQALILTNATVVQVRQYGGANQDVVEITNLNLRVENVANGQTGKLALQSEVQVVKNPPAPAPGGTLQASLDSQYEFALSPDLKPISIHGKSQLHVARAGGDLSELADAGVIFNCQINSTNIEQVALSVQRGSENMGGLRASGPFDIAKLEGDLQVELVSLDHRALDLIGAGSGIRFGNTSLSSTNHIHIANAGGLITASGVFAVENAQLTQGGKTTPTLGLRAASDLSVNQAANAAEIRTLDLTGTQNGRQFLDGKLSSPMGIALGNTSNALSDAAFTLVVTNLDLSAWKDFAGDLVSSGVVNANLQLASRDSGNRLDFDLGSAIEDLAAQSGSNTISQVNVRFAARGNAVKMQQFKLDEYQLQVAQRQETALALSGSGNYDSAGSNADAQLKVEAFLSPLLRLASPGASTVSSGTLTLNSHVTQQGELRKVAGSMILTNLSGAMGASVFHDFGSAMELAVTATPDLIQVEHIKGGLTQAGKAGGNFDLAASCNLTNSAAQFSARLDNFNQNGLRPFLEPMLGGRRLVSISLNGAASGSYANNGATSIKADLQVTNLVAAATNASAMPEPLEARFQADAGVSGNVADVRQCQITLTPTERGKNQLDLDGRVDFSQATAIRGNLQLAAESLDLTHYYNLMSGGTNVPATATAGTAPQKPAPSPAPAQPEQEPAAVQLPFQDFTLGAKIGRIVLDEVDITNLQCSVLLASNKVAITPCQLGLNGAPVNADVKLDLGVPGYIYNVAFNADQIPLAPLVNSFAPDRKGQIGGTLSAHAKIQGAGITGANLQKNLNGNFDLGTTNLNLLVLNIDNLPAPKFMRTLIKLVVNVVGTVPELIRNPGSAATSLLGSVTGKGGLTAELQKTPINIIAASGTAGGGKVEIKQATIQSPAFEAVAQGDVTLAPVLTNSPVNIPVVVSLSRNLAQNLSLTSSETSASAEYVPLPQFLTITGTVGDPRTKINPLALAGTTIKSAGKLIQGMEGILKGNSAGESNSAPNSTTNQTPIKGLLNNLFGPKKK